MSERAGVAQIFDFIFSPGSFCSHPHLAFEIYPFNVVTCKMIIVYNKLKSCMQVF